MTPYVFAMLAALFWGIAPIMVKISLNELPPFITLSMRSFTVSIVLLIAGLVSGQYRNLNFESKYFFLAGAEGILSALVGQLFYYHALKSGEVSRIVPVSSSFPLIALAISVLFFHEKLSAFKLIGAGLIFIGITLIKK
jgi:transporter family protein